ncbi:hypothetical protein [Spirillospora sp. CA-128828]|uniref:hypothetical protein n=1 Tax=Spirillospora sp. CA-128828 TaxID=3240033 RepID=UPI003D92D404
MTWFKVDDSFYDHPKVFDLPDSAVALWTRAGCWSARNGTGGTVPARLPARLCENPEEAARALVDAGLWERVRGGGYRFHDWDTYQPTRDEAVAARSKKSSGGRLGNHRRWHLERGVIDPRCHYCTTPAANRTDAGTDGGSDAEPMPKRPAENDNPQAISTGGGDTQSDAEDQVNGGTGSDNRSESDRMNRSGTESGPNPPVPTRPDPSRRDGGSVGESSSGSRRASETDDDEPTTHEQTIDRLIVDVLTDLTGRTVDDPHAAKVRRQLLDGRQVANPMAYVSKALRERPNDFLPADTPADRPPPPRPQLDPERAQAGAAEARRLLAERRKADA